MFLPLILLPALVSSEGILDSLLRPLMTQLDGMASHLSSPSQQLHDKGIPGQSLWAVSEQGKYLAAMFLILRLNIIYMKLRVLVRNDFLICSLHRTFILFRALQKKKRQDARVNYKSISTWDMCRIFTTIDIHFLCFDEDFFHTSTLCNDDILPLLKQINNPSNECVYVSVCSSH